MLVLALDICFYSTLWTVIWIYCISQLSVTTRHFNWCKHGRGVRMHAPLTAKKSGKREDEEVAVYRLVNQSQIQSLSLMDKKMFMPNIIVAISKWITGVCGLRDPAKHSFRCCLADVQPVTVFRVTLHARSSFTIGYCKLLISYQSLTVHDVIICIVIRNQNDLLDCEISERRAGMGVSLCKRDLWPSWKTFGWL